jgi:hypothetical protein
MLFGTCRHLLCCSSRPISHQSQLLFINLFVHPPPSPTSPPLPIYLGRCFSSPRVLSAFKSSQSLLDTHFGSWVPMMCRLMFCAAPPLPHSPKTTTPPTSSLLVMIRLSIATNRGQVGSSLTSSSFVSSCLEERCA